jgi:glycosyltransferase involved in cell wall biosynthesis
MKLLLSAYACEPNKGSEPGVGWGWALEITRLGHEVWVLTRTNNRSNIEAELAKSKPIPNLHFVYYDLPAWARWWKKGERGIHLYYLLWQWGAYLLAKKVHKVERFEQVHHITFVGIRQPSFMGNLGIPFIFGPVSGGERAPRRLRKSYSLRNKIWEGCKDLSNYMIKIDPLMGRTFKQAERIYVTSAWNISLIPPKYQHKASVLLPIGFNHNELPDSGEPKVPNLSNKDSFKVLYVGNLLYMKGMHLGIPAFARLLKVNPNATLTVVGSGPDGPRWKAIAEKLGVNGHIEWIPRMDRLKLSSMYSTHDVHIYPTLQDPGGMVILEALSHGLPVACLDHKGSGEIIDETCGLNIEAEGLNEEQVIEALADRLIQLAQDPERLHCLSNGALRQAEKFRWPAVVGQIYKVANGTGK